MVRVTGIGAVLALGAVLAGCEDKPKDTPATTSTSASTAASAQPATSVAAVIPSAAASAAPEKPMGPPRGPGGMLFAAAKGLTLDATQKPKVDEAMKSLKDVDPETQADAKDAMTALRTELATEVKAGKIDTAKMKPSYDAIEKAATADQEKDADAVNALHAALTPEQRKAVAADLRAKQAMMDEKMAKKDANAATADKAKGLDAFKPGEGASPAARELKWMTGDLGLDEKQQKDIDALAAKDDPTLKQTSKRFEDLAKEFEKDTFDAKKSDLFKPKNLRDPLEARTATIDKVTKILKPEQREKLAAKLEKGPPMHGMGGMGGMGGHGGGGMMGGPAGGHGGHDGAPGAH